MIDLWQEIYGTIKRNKLRTFLTGFAVAWGIFMLIVLLGAGNGIIHAFEQNASERALNSIRLGGGWTTQSYEGLKEGRRIQLENKDLAATEKYFPDNIITAGATLRQGDVNISFGQEYINISLMGVHPNYVESEAIKTASGRFINRNDVKERRKVIILHKKSAEILFGKSRTEPVGRFVNAGGVATSGLEMTQNAMHISWSAEEVDKHLHQIMSDIHTQCVKYGTENNGYINYMKGANIAGFMKVAHAMMGQGII